MKKKKSTKIVTLPIGAEMMYQALAEIAWSVEDKKEKLDKGKFIGDVLQELGKEAFLHSFTPSGEIGSGDNGTVENPQSPRISATFYDAFDDLFGEKNGKISKAMRVNTSSERVLKNRMFRFKSSIINLVQLYLESQMSLRTNDREKSKRNQPKNIDRITDFNYKKRKNETDEEWYDYLTKIEENRYVRMFVATIFFTTISDLFLTDVDEMAKTIKSRNLTGAENITDFKKKFSKLKSPGVREQFVRNVRNMWKLTLRAPSNKKVSIARQEEFELGDED